MLAADYAGAPVVRHSTVLDGADPPLSGPGGTGGQRLVGTLLGAGLSESAGPGAGSASVGECTGLRWARHELAGPGWLVVALGTDPAALARVLSDAASDDAGVVPGDAGVVPGDAGVVPGDAGVVPGDAGVVPGDAGVVPGDAGAAPGVAGAALAPR
jgi:hypothetical protein